MPLPDGEISVSVAISTYNRCRQLRHALASLVAQDTAEAYEVLVVDNNSTDDTRAVASSFIESGRPNLRYLFEKRQGLSYGRNTAIANSRAPLIAFTDDDVEVAPDWISNAIGAFRDHPEVDFVGGKVIPRWPEPPPEWLTEEHWAPLAVLDYGDSAVYIDSANPLCLIGANLSFRKSVFERIGLFSPDLQRVKDSVGSMEDHEFISRLWKAGGRGLYVPEMVVYAPVAPERLSKAYHRRWHAGHGSFYAIARLDNFDGQSDVAATGDSASNGAANGRVAGGPAANGASTEVAVSGTAASQISNVKFQIPHRRFLGVPFHAYRQFGADAASWIWNRVTANPDRAFARELRLRFFLGFFRARLRHSRDRTI